MVSGPESWLSPILSSGMADDKDEGNKLTGDRQLKNVRWISATLPRPRIALQKKDANLVHQAFVKKLGTALGTFLRPK